MYRRSIERRSLLEGPVGPYYFLVYRCDVTGILRAIYLREPPAQPLGVVISYMECPMEHTAKELGKKRYFTHTAQAVLVTCEEKSKELAQNQASGLFPGSLLLSKNRGRDGKK